MKRAGVECKRCGGQILGDSCLQCGYQIEAQKPSPLLLTVPSPALKRPLDDILAEYVATSRPRLRVVR